MNKFYLLATVVAEAMLGVAISAVSTVALGRAIAVTSARIGFGVRLAATLSVAVVLGVIVLITEESPKNEQNDDDHHNE